MITEMKHQITEIKKTDNIIHFGWDNISVIFSFNLRNLILNKAR